jgi:hypothetical protein
MLAKPEKYRPCSRGNPRRDLRVGLRRHVHRQCADKRPSVTEFRPFGWQPGEADLVIGLYFRRFELGIRRDEG